MKTVYIVEIYSELYTCLLNSSAVTPNSSGVHQYAFRVSGLSNLDLFFRFVCRKFCFCIFSFFWQHEVGCYARIAMVW